MNFAGYIPLNRGLIEHTMDRRLTNNEALVFVWLLMLADRKTGSYTINGPTLRTFLPGLSKGAAQDALEGLHKKRYIYRDVTPRSIAVYRYWVDKFTPTDGPHRNLQLDLSEVFATNDTSKLRFVEAPPATPPATQLGTQLGTPPATPNNNKKEKEKDNHKENPLGSTGECATESASAAQRVSTEGSTSGEGGAPQLRTECATTAQQLPDDCSATARQLPRGFELRGDGGVYSSSGVRVAANVLAALLEQEGQL